MTALRQRMLEDLPLRNLSPLTPRASVEHVARVARYVGRSPAVWGSEEIRASPLYVIHEQQWAPASLVIAVAARRFLSKVTLQKTWSVDDVIPPPTQPQTWPVGLSPADVVQLLDCVTTPPPRTILTTCDAAGLRLSDAVGLTLPAIDRPRMVRRVAQGPGQNDRDVMRSPTRLPIVRDWWRVSRPRHWLFPGAQPGHPITSRAAARRPRPPPRRPPTAFHDAIPIGERPGSGFVQHVCRPPSRRPASRGSSTSSATAPPG